MQLCLVERVLITNELTELLQKKVGNNVRSMNKMRQKAFTSSTFSSGNFPSYVIFASSILLFLSSPYLKALLRTGRWRLTVAA